MAKGSDEATCCGGVLAGFQRALRRAPTREGIRPRQRRLVLVGMRAAGKSTLGKVAAKRLGQEFFDLDQILEEQVFGCTINSFVDVNGWAKFREAEAQLLEDVIVHGRYITDPTAGCVVATGGGVVETPSALVLLETHFPVLWIDRHIDDIICTLEGVGSYRPGLGMPPGEIYARRRPLYERCSDFAFAMRRGDDNWLCLERRFAELSIWACRADGAGGPAMQNPVCIPIVAETLTDALSQLSEAASQGAGLVELRVDTLRGGTEAINDSLPQLLSKTRYLGLPSLVTCRPVWEDPNAGYSGDETPRLKVLQRAAQLGATFVDVERAAVHRWAAIGGLPRGSRTRLVISSHNFTEFMGLSALRELFAQMRGPDAQVAGAGADCIVKVAQMARSSADAARMLAVLAEQPGSAVALAMGQAGEFSRILAPYLGAAFSFGCLPGRASAPGQPPSTELLETYHLGTPATRRKVFALVGDSCVGNKLPVLLNAGFAAEGFHAVLVPIPIHGCSLKEFFASLPAGLLAGVALLPSHAAAAGEVLGGGTATVHADALVRSVGNGWAAAVMPDRMAALQRGEVTSAAASEAIAFYEVFRGERVPLVARQVMNGLAS